MAAEEYVSRPCPCCRDAPGGTPGTFRRRRKRSPFLCGDDEDTGAEFQSHLDRIGNAGAGLFLHRETIDNDLDRVELVAVEAHPFGNLAHGPVDADPEEAVPQNLPEQLTVMPLPRADDRGEKLHLRPPGKIQYAVDDLVRRLLLYLLPAVRAILRPGPCEQEPEIVVDLGNSADS